MQLPTSLTTYSWGEADGCDAVGDAVTDADGPLVVGTLVGLVVGDTMWWGEAVGCDAVGDAVTDADGPLVVGGKLRGAIVVKSMDRRQMEDSGPE